MKEYKVIVEGNIEKWYLNDNLVKEIKYYSNGQKTYEYYYLDGERHREDGPARKGWYENGQKQYEHYWLNGKLHREDGPARKGWYENGQKEYEEYWLNGKLHREDGPALQRWYEIGQKRYEEYWLNGKTVSKEDVMKSNKIIIIDGKEVSKDTIKMALRDYFK